MRPLALRCQGLASGQAEPAIEAVALARWARLLVEQAGADAGQAGSGPGCGRWASACARAVSLLVAERLTNGAPARRLSISPHTVSTHLRHVSAKRGVPNRAALAAVVHHSIK